MNSRLKALGETVLRVKDLEAVKRFYTDVIGLDVLQELDGIAFLKVAGGYGGHTQIVGLFHESLPAPFPMDPREPVRLQSTSLHHFALEIDKADFGAEKTRLERLGVEVTTFEHRWCRWRSLYVRDPEGNILELVCHDPTIGSTEAPATRGSRFRQTLASAGSWTASVLDSARIGPALEFGLYAFVVLMSTWPLVWLINWSLARDSATFGLSVVGLSAALLVVWAGLISNEQVLRNLETVHKFPSPTVFAVAFAWVAMVVFGGATCGLQRIDIVEIAPVVSHTDDCATKYADLYFWHLLHSIPVITFPDTVRWKLKYTYSDPVSGWLLLGFKLIVVVPVIGSFVAMSRARRERAKAQQKGPAADEGSASPGAR
jgi:catechol 2,3-dioxygenase-like lactoylglutathione lyase family enzyme